VELSSTRVFLSSSLSPALHRSGANGVPRGRTGGEYAFDWGWLQASVVVVVVVVVVVLVLVVVVVVVLVLVVVVVVVVVDFVALLFL